MNRNSNQKQANKRTSFLVVGVTSLFSLLLIALLFSIGDKEPKQQKREQSKDVIDLLDSETPRTSTQNADGPEAIGLELPQGGWVQQTDEFGNLSQQYRCESLDPNPPDLPVGWIEMQKPELEIFLSDNSLVVITGDKGIANAPQRILESGEIAGHVRVEKYELDENGKRLTEAPSMVLTTPQASFDNFLGEITCDSEVRIVSSSQKLSGRKLTVRFNDKAGRIEYLRLEELDYLEFYPEAKTVVTPQSPTPIARRNTNKQKNVKSSHRILAAAIEPSHEYYLLSFLDNVTILQGEQHTGRVAFGDKLTVAFSDESDTSSVATASTRPRTTTMLPLSIQTTLVATALASSQVSQAPLQTATQPPVRLTCDDGLLMLPLLDESLQPQTPDDTRIELFSSPTSPAKLIDNIENLTASGDLLRYELNKERVDLFGAPSSLTMNGMETRAKHLWVARSNGVGGAIGEGEVNPVDKSANATSLQWNDGVDFFFDAEDDALEKVVCNGEVVLAEENSTVHCETLTVHFAPDEDGGSSPTVAIATGDVLATSDTQTMWSNEARVTFARTTDNSTDEDSMFKGSQADKMLASGDVQVLLDDGGRAFCDSLEGDIAQDIAKLEGNVVIAYKRMLMNRGDFATLTLDRATGKGRWEGAGQALFLDTPLDVSANHKIKRPNLDGSTTPEEEPINISMRANWKKTMQLDRTFNENAGAVDLEGNVDVRSQRTPIDRSQMTGQNLRLEFDLLHANTAKEERQLKKVIAKNDAKIEHRAWEAHALDAPPVVYYIGGNHIEFDAITLETLAVGIGELVLRDPRAPEAKTHQSSLAGRGTTRFTWDKKLTTTKLSESLYRIEMNGNVQMLHKGLGGEVGMLTSDRIEAIAVDPDQVTTNADGSSELTMRGMDLQQLIATGSVYVATNARTVDCNIFDYNLRTGIATLSAGAGGSVAILTQGNTTPVRAESIRWNMDPAIDTITIRGLHGSSPQ